MTSPVFAVQKNPNPATDEQLAEIFAAPGFGNYFTDHMALIDWDPEQGWHDPRVVPYAPFSIDPASMVLHYGQEIFEGLKAYRQPDGSVAAFRPDANAKRMAGSARRLALPELGEELFVGALRALVEVDKRWVPSAEHQSLYLRPFMFASEVGLGVRPSSEVTFCVIASPAGSYFSGGVAPVTVWLSTEYVRASPGGTGEAKCGGNYAASLLAQADAAAKGCDQVVWLDAVERRWVEEMGTNNLCFVFNDGNGGVEVVTPELNGSLLPGITRDSLMKLSKDLGYTATERRISTDEWAKSVDAGEITEVFGCGTAAVVTPVGQVKSVDGEFGTGAEGLGPVAAALREELVGIQNGTKPDRHGWMVSLAD
ncbi:branched-chain amino acid aminotransferase [Nakamurella aerolata]|uniref:branched-chain-amino-acid transaminase n=1 Tax=Nakamurella aerolata TaxID=1656892 RepID=A0A849ABU2_9ACTN|nr:branched-chain amino acid aminotransferase [Nakamurella aerolata]NNG37163.1 branched-chain amino acid aminotransferase [Nakamurella aerolata]